MRKHFLLIGDDADPAFIQLIGGMTVAGQELRALTGDELDRLGETRGMRRGVSLLPKPRAATKGRITRVHTKPRTRTAKVDEKSAWENLREIVGDRFSSFRRERALREFTKRRDPTTGKNFTVGTFNALISKLGSARIIENGEAGLITIRNKMRFRTIGTTELNEVRAHHLTEPKKAATTA
jgi:hypothetical protein